MSYQSKLNYIKEYKRKTYKPIYVPFRFDDEEQMKLYDWLHTKYSVAGYIRDVLFEAMEKEEANRTAK